MVIEGEIIPKMFIHLPELAHTFLSTLQNAFRIRNIRFCISSE